MGRRSEGDSWGNCLKGSTVRTLKKQGDNEKLRRRGHNHNTILLLYDITVFVPLPTFWGQGYLLLGDDLCLYEYSLKSLWEKRCERSVVGHRTGLGALYPLGLVPEPETCRSAKEETVRGRPGPKEVPVETRRRAVPTPVRHSFPSYRPE